MRGARIAIAANTITMENPAIPKALPRTTENERFNAFGNRRRNRRLATAVAKGDSSEADTRIEYSVKDVGHDVPKNHEDGDDPKERARQELVLVHNRPQEIVAESEV